MLFSNATVIKLSAPIAADLDSILNDAPFEGFQIRPLWHRLVPLIETESATMTRAYGQRVLFCGRREEKVIPASAVKEEVTARVLKQETLDGQPLSTSAKRSIKDDVLAEMLPRALCKSKRIQIYHDPEQSALILNLV